MDKKEILNRLRLLTNTSSIMPYWGLPRAEFEARSYTQWAVNEVLRAIEKSDLPPLLVAEAFSNKMNDYACAKESSSWKFSVAHDAAEWIVNLLLG